MTEKNPQSHPEKPQTTFLVENNTGEIQPARLTGYTRIDHVLHRDGTYVDVGYTQVEFPKAAGLNGEARVRNQMVLDSHLSEDYQANVAEQLHDGLYDTQRVDVPSGMDSIGSPPEWTRSDKFHLPLLGRLAIAKTPPDQDSDRVRRQRMEGNSNSSEEHNVRDITSAPSIRRLAEEVRARRDEADTQAMRQYYAENPDLDRSKRQAMIAAIGMRLIRGEKE